MCRNKFNEVSLKFQEVSLLLSFMKFRKKRVMKLPTPSGGAYFLWRFFYQEIGGGWWWGVFSHAGFLPKNCFTFMTVLRWRTFAYGVFILNLPY